MKTHLPTFPSFLILIILGLPFFAPIARSEPASANTFMGGVTAPAIRDGQHDFDFLWGSWKLHMKKLVKPLTGSTTWEEFDGTSSTRPLFGGRANVEQLIVDGAGGKIEGMTLRMYNPQSGQWSVYWGNLKDGSLGVPVIPTVGSFANGRAELYDQESINGRVIFVRYEWSDITPNSAKFEQSFSADGGKTWEVNWASTQTRIPDDSAAK